MAGVLEGEIELDGQFTQPASCARCCWKAISGGSYRQPFCVPARQRYEFVPAVGRWRTSESTAEIKTRANWFGGVQLLTLSACNTGVGDGAEVESFGTLAQRQGAKAVVASLWPVVDASTAVLMREFYRIRETNTVLTKLDALREAQLELLRGMTTGSAASLQRGLVHDQAAPWRRRRVPGAPPREIGISAIPTSGRHFS